MSNFKFNFRNDNLPPKNRKSKQCQKKISMKHMSNFKGDKKYVTFPNIQQS